MATSGRVPLGPWRFVRHLGFWERPYSDGKYVAVHIPRTPEQMRAVEANEARIRESDARDEWGD